VAARRCNRVDNESHVSTFLRHTIAISLQTHERNAEGVGSITTSAHQNDAGLPDLAKRFRAIYTAALADVLDSLGYRQQTLPAGIAPISKGVTTAGPIFAVEGRGREMEREPSIRRILEMLGSIPAHHVAVYQPGDERCAHFGELSATALVARRCAGVIIDGGCRDVPLVEKTGLPTFFRYTTPLDAVGRWDVVEWGHEVEIAGVAVATGDYVVADADGAVIIPACVRDDVLEQAEAMVLTENEVRTAVKGGMAPLEAYDRFGKF
jgi:4-hydroxy-4-methyl-2-oxoglutarate aldolase